jgi:oligopeptide transport system substrate-binding protein
MKRKAGIYLLLGLVYWTVQACKQDEASTRELKKAEGNRYYGGTMRYNEEEYFKSLYPLNVTEVTGHRIAEQIYEGLVAFDQATLDIRPALAKSWEIDDSGTQYTFHLRTDVFFHDDPCFPDGKGRRFTAQDVKYCFDRLCYYNPADNQGFWIFKDVVKGANEYQEATKNQALPDQGVEGVRVLNDSTLLIELYTPYSVFLSRLGLIFGKIYPREAVAYYGGDLRTHPVGTGPFMPKIMKENEVFFMTRHPKYWQKDEWGNQLPYLDHIKVTFVKEKRAELLSFKKGEIDFVYRLPLDMVDEVLLPGDRLRPEYEAYILQHEASMSLQYYGFLHAHPIFRDRRVRQAFCYAVDRERLCTYTLRGAGFPAKYGMVPPGTGTYNPTVIRGYTYDPSKAKQLLAEAGYPNGKGFPKITLQLNSGGGRNSQVAEAIQKMLTETLGISVDILSVPWPQHTEAVESAKAAFWRLGWIADYPDAENFLNLFHSKHVPADISVKTYINSFRYKNKAFDTALDAAMRSTVDSVRNAYYAAADQTAIDDAVVLPLFYDKDYRLLQATVRNFPQNAMEYRRFTEVYFAPAAEDIRP